MGVVGDPGGKAPHPDPWGMAGEAKARDVIFGCWTRLELLLPAAAEACISPPPPFYL